MVYSPSQVVACVKVQGKVLREAGNVVTLPFGSEYSILVKNLNTTRIKVRVSIDGTDATQGLWLVVNPNDDLELERFIRDGNLKAGNRFKFIERTTEIEAHRGIKPDDGLIRIEYQVEKRVVVDEVIHHTKHVYESPYNPYEPYWPRRYSWEITCSSAPIEKRLLRSTGLRVDQASVSAMGLQAEETSAGITVAGSESSQEFKMISEFQTGASQVIVLQLQGVVGGKVAKKAVTVDMKPKCETCGRVNKAGNKFCSNCGTALSII